MAVALEDYRRLLVEAHVENQNELFRFYVIIYIVVNIIWLALNYMGSIKVEPMLAIWYLPFGWGLLIIFHWWSYVRNAADLCKLNEKTTKSKMH
jgi:hypothetical protein